ncbi:MAG: PIG-L family deacetylase [Candidatus Limnocylindrales bacterium]
MAATHSVMLVHAHPDDETIATGGVMSRYSHEGHRVICVTCTGGEHGEIVVREMDTPENHARLAEIRRGELERALAQLGPITHHWLGYHDSGMMSTPHNDATESFWQADHDEATARIVRLIRQERPEVLVSYNDFGGYGHPDHIRAATTTKLAFQRAGDPAAHPEQLAEGLQPWQPLKLYETVLDIGRRTEFIDLMKEKGIKSWWVPPDDETDEQRAEREGHQQQMTDAQGPVTTRVSIIDQTEAKLAAMREHVTQLPAEGFFLAFDADEWRNIQPTEDFTLIESRQGVRLPEDDLFAGLPATSA